MTVKNPAPGGGTSATVGPWTPTGTMTASRANHTQTLLQNGKVLLAGGGYVNGLSDVIAASAEIYDPASHTFAATGNMTDARASHTATLLGNGKVLITGGHNNSGAVVASAELYDPSAGAFTATGNMTTSRLYQTATLLSNGTVLIAGGYNASGQILATAEVYNPATGTFSPTGSMSAPRYAHTATLLTSGKVLVAGGQSISGGTNIDLASAELYDPSTGTFAPTGNLVMGREFATATLLNNGNVLVAGGGQLSTGTLILQEADIYNSSAGTFSAAGSMGTPRYVHSAALLNDGTVLVTGGFDGSSVLSSAELYSPVSGKFAPAWSMAAVRELAAATTLPDGSVLVAGGAGNQGFTQLLASAEVYPSPSSSAATAAAEFTVNNPVPVITNLSATTSPSGTQVTITGNNFVNSADVLLNGFAVPSYGNPSTPSSIWFYPSLAGSYSVAVNNPSPGGGVSNTVSLQVTVNVQVSPARALWATGSTNQFSATVLGTNNTNVTWSVREGASGGTINSTGAYTAPSAPGTYHVIATSQADLMQSAVAPIIVGPGAGQMTVGPNTISPHAHSTAILLSSGKVLIAGGGASDSAELYDPSTNTFSSTGSLTSTTQWAQAVLLASGKVLIAGGGLDGALLYDPSAKTFLPTIGSMVVPNRGTCAMATLQNGKVLIVGGEINNNALSSTEIYNPTTDTFTATSSMSTARSVPTATLLNNGKVLIAGGWSAASPYGISSAELYDPASGTFTPTGSMTTGGDAGTATLLSSGKVLIVGLYGSYSGAPAELYDPASGTFSESATPPVYPLSANVSTTLLPNGLVFITGGLLMTGTAMANSPNQTEFYDTATNSFYAGPLMSQKREWMTMTQLQNGNVLIIGGTSQDVFYPTDGVPPAGDIYIPASTNPIP